jgi:hypothetical protein
MNSIVKAKKFLRGLLAVLPAMVALPAGAAGNLKTRLESDLQHIDASASRDVRFLLLDGAENSGDAPRVAAFLAQQGDLDTAVVADIESTFSTNQGKKSVFHAFPYAIPLGKSEHTRKVCIIRFDYSTHYSLDTLLRALKINRVIVASAGIDLSRVTSERILLHIWHHEVWHCLDTLAGQAPAYAFLLDNAAYPTETLYSAYKRYAETGADIFASLLDLQEYGDTQLTKLVSLVRAENLRLKDLDHFSSPALDDIAQHYSASELKGCSLSQVVAATDILREKYTVPLDQFQVLKEAYDPAEPEAGAPSAIAGADGAVGDQEGAE